MEKITSRQNQKIKHIKALSDDRGYRKEQQCYVCDGEKLLWEALHDGVCVREIYWKEGHIPTLTGTDVSAVEYWLPESLFTYISPLKNSSGPVFTVEMPQTSLDKQCSSVVVLDTLQDPGNVGTVLRTANAFGIDMVVLTGACADIYHPKTVRASMGAMFRQRFLELGYTELPEFLSQQNLLLYGAALSAHTLDLRILSGKNQVAVAIGSEGKGLSQEILSLCHETVKIPMAPGCESLNAAVAASVIMWEISKHTLL